MYIRTALRRMECWKCKGTIFKNEPCITTGTEEEHGPTICMRCIISAHKSIELGEDYKSDHENHYLIKNPWERNIRCSLCYNKIKVGEFVWVSEYTTKLKFRKGRPVDYDEPDRTDYICPTCIKKFVESIDQDILDSADINLFEFKMKKINPAS